MVTWRYSHDKIFVMKGRGGRDMCGRPMAEERYEEVCRMEDRYDGEGWNWSH
jgi:hypothetical protein